MSTEIKSLFILSSATGHLNPNICFIKHLKSEYNIQSYLFCAKDSEEYLKKHGLKFYVSETHPFGIGREDKIIYNRGLGFLHNLILRGSFNLFIERQKELSYVFNEVKPTFVFIDYHFSTDYIVLKTLNLKYVKKIILIHSIYYPYHSFEYPNLNSYLLPTNKFKIAFKYWQFILSGIINRVIKKLQYFGLDDYSQIMKVIRNSNLIKFITINNRKIKFVSFNELEEWTLRPIELEFNSNQIPKSYKFLGNYFLKSIEEIDNNTSQFIKLNRKLGRKVIFVSLGTVHMIHTKNRSAQFFKKICRIADLRKEYSFLISTGNCSVDYLIKNFNIEYVDNIIVKEYFPQFNLLKEIDLFITHGGSNSIIEAINQKCPMIVVPLNNKYDQTGNSMRIEYHNLGIKMKFESSDDVILRCIEYMFLNDDNFKTNLSNMKNKIDYKLNLQNLLFD